MKDADDRDAVVGGTVENGMLFKPSHPPSPQFGGARIGEISPLADAEHASNPLAGRGDCVLETKGCFQDGFDREIRNLIIKVATGEAR